MKTQDGVKFTQLEGAMGSTLLNLDGYFRKEFNQSIVSFVNLSSDDRESFFLPIKKREDFEEIKSKLNNYIGEMYA